VRALQIAVVVSAALVVALVNAASTGVDMARHHVRVAPFEPLVWELTSWLGLVVALPGLIAADSVISSQRPLGLRIGMVVALAAIFFGVHLATMIGLREVMIPNLPTRPYHDPYYEPLWEVLEDIGLPVVTHTATQEEQLDLTVTSVPLNAWVVDEKIVNMMRCLSRLIAGGVPQRHPRLRFVMVESGIGWIAGMLRFMDHWWEDHHKWMQPTLQEPPSVYFKQQFWATFEDDRPGVVTRHLLNPDHLMWGSDYPHSEGTFPHSKERIEQDFADIPEAETRRLVRDNAAEFYGLSLT